jgi:hypothetical protein
MFTIQFVFNHKEHKEGTRLTKIFMEIALRTLRETLLPIAIGIALKF